MIPHTKAYRVTHSEGSRPQRWAPLLVIVVCAALALLLPINRRLVVAESGGRTLLTLPIKPDETFQIRFTHSLNLSDITDTIAYTGGKLVCRSTLFTAYGAGIPDLSDGIGTTFTETADGFLLSGIDKQETEIPILLQAVPNHRLLWRGGEYNLYQLRRSGALITIRVQRVSLLTILTHNNAWR